MGLVVHGMQGFDFEKARTTLKVPDDYAVAAMFAAGRPAPVDVLPEKFARAREADGPQAGVGDYLRRARFAFAHK